MGERGVRRTAAGDRAAVELVAALSDHPAFAGVLARPMFGGHGVFVDGIMFALVDADGRCFLRVGPANAEAFEAAASPAHGRMPYRQIPAFVRSDPTALPDWASTALVVARAAKRR